MKFVSIFVLVCALACASAQDSYIDDGSWQAWDGPKYQGVKGGASDTASGVRSGTFYPRLSSFQGTKGNIRSSVALIRPSELVADDADLTGRMVDQRGLYVPLSRNVQPTNRFLYDNRRPTQYVQYDAVPMSTYSGYNRNYYSQPQVASLQRVPTFTATRYGSDNYGTNTLGRQYGSQAIVSRPALLSSIAPLSTYSSGSSGYRPAVGSVAADYVVPSVSSAALPVATYPRTTPVSVTPVSGNVFTDNKISSPGTILTQDRPGYAIPAVPNLRSIAPIPSPQSGYTISSVPTVSAGYAVPSVSSAPLPTLSIQAPTSSPAIPVGQIFTDNKISGSPSIQSQLPITQEKFSGIVQTTEW